MRYLVTMQCEVEEEVVACCEEDAEKEAARVLPKDMTIISSKVTPLPTKEGSCEDHSGQ